MISNAKEKLAKYNFKQEELEIRRDVKTKTDYPKPTKRFRLQYEAENHNVEEMFYWMQNQLGYELSFPEMIKITDSHAASVASSTFGDMQQRIGAQQSNVSNYMGMMGKLLKDLFALVRELRQLEERLAYYTNSYKEDKKEAHPAESTLKDIWITLVEGGTQNPSSVYGMSQKVGFTILPDLFFSAPPLTKDEIQKHISSLEFNESVKRALERKLYQFAVWKEETHKELHNKRRFQIRYLRQHYEVIRMYMEWIKPYLKNLRRLGNSENMMDDPRIIHSFETALSEIEVLYMKKMKDNPDPRKTIYAVIMMHFEFRTRPQMGYHAKESWQQKGPIHMGRTDLTMRAYGWTKADVENYKKYREEETFDILRSFDASVSDSMEYLGADLERYLIEAEATIPEGMFKKKKEEKEEKKEEKKTNSLKNTGEFILSPFTGIIELVDPILGLSGLVGKKKSKKGQLHKDEIFLVEEQKKGAAKDAAGKMYLAYKNYKKANKMFSW